VGKKAGPFSHLLPGLFPVETPAAQQHFGRRINGTPNPAAPGDASAFAPKKHFKILPGQLHSGYGPRLSLQPTPEKKKTNNFFSKKKGAFLSAFKDSLFLSAFKAGIF